MSEDTPWLSQTQLYNWLHLSGALTALPASVEQQLKRDSGLNFYEYSILSGLSVAPGRAMQMSTLASSALGSPSRLSHAITRLECAGWVQRRAFGNPTGKTGRGSRAVEAVLTDEGYAKIVEAAPMHVEHVRRLVVDVLSEQEFGQLQQLLRKILVGFSPETVELIDGTFSQQSATEPSMEHAFERCLNHQAPQPPAPVVTLPAEDEICDEAS